MGDFPWHWGLGAFPRDLGTDLGTIPCGGLGIGNKVGIPWDWVREAGTSAKFHWNSGGFFLAFPVPGEFGNSLECWGYLGEVDGFVLGDALGVSAGEHPAVAAVHLLRDLLQEHSHQRSQIPPNPSQSQKSGRNSSAGNTRKVPEFLDFLHSHLPQIPPKPFPLVPFPLPRFGICSLLFFPGIPKGKGAQKMAGNPWKSQILWEFWAVQTNLALLAQQGPSIGVEFLPFLIQTFLFQVLPAGKGVGKAGIYGKMGILRFSLWLFPKGFRVGIYKLIPPQKI